MSSRALFLSPYPSSVPSHRVRLEQYAPALRAAGIDLVIRSLLDERSYRARGPALAWALTRGSLRRAAEALAARKFDVVLVHREMLPLPTSVPERLIGRVARRLVFDFDDAIYLPQPYSRRPFARWLGSPRKFDAAVAAADRVFAGNRTLGERAARVAHDVRIIPSVVDTDRITPRSPRGDGQHVVLGWIGSPSTAHYLELILPALADVLRRHPRAILRIVGASLPRGLADRAEALDWALAREVDDLRSFDIGLMPLPDDEWARGKCGYKALQYMSAAVPTISSPVGVATEMIADGVTGMLARTPEEWISKLDLLIADVARRHAIGQAGREDVLSRYSLRVWTPRFIDALMS